MKSWRGKVTKTMASASVHVRDEVVEHAGDLLYGCLCKGRRLASLVTSSKWEEKEREVHLLSQSLREASIDDELCSRFQLEQAWGIKSDNAEVVWSLLRGLGAVVVGESGCELVSVAELAQVVYISLVVKDATLRRKKEAVLASEPSSSAQADREPLDKVRPGQVPSRPSPTLADDASPSSSSTHHLQKKKMTIKADLVAGHLESLLRLVLGVPPTCLSSSLVVTSADVDALGIWLRPDRADKGLRLSQASPFFTAHLHASFKDVADWLKAAAGPGAGQTLRIAGVQKEVVARDLATVNKDPTCLSVTNCVDSTVYCPFPVEFLLVSQCKNCTIFVGCAKVAQTLQCSSTKVVVASKTTVVSTCADCDFYLGTNECPLLVGDNRNVTLAPHNSPYDGFARDLEKFGVSGDVNYWNLPKVVESPHSEGDHGGVFSLMPPEDWREFAVPFVRRDGVEETTAPRPFPPPKAFQRSLEEVAATVEGVRAQITGANLAEAQRGELQRAIRAHFKDWLVRDGHFAEIQSLTEMEAAG